MQQKHAVKAYADEGQMHLHHAFRISKEDSIDPKNAEPYGHIDSMLHLFLICNMIDRSNVAEFLD
eukprot:scaffold5231_cov83-Cylindrotheca_fusiformis.AAC.1